MNTHTLLTLALASAMLLPSWGSEQQAPTDPYAPPFYNNEDVPLPAWVKEELRDINTQLRAKLSPSDYLEILKGEYHLMGEYKTKAQYNKSANPAKLYGAENLKNIAQLKSKLRQILEHPDDRNLFARAEIIPVSEEGTYYRDSLRNTDEEIDHVGPAGILTRAEGKSGAESMQFTFWDARTCRAEERFAVPHYMSRVGCRLLPDGSPVYALPTFHGEIGNPDWSGNIYATYLWEPLKKRFQSIRQNNGLEVGLFNPDTPGDVFLQCETQLDSHLASDEQGHIVLSGWDIGKQADALKELGIQQNKDKAGKTATYISALLQHNGSISFYRAFDKDGSIPDENATTEDLHLATLTRKQQPYDGARNERIEQLKTRLKQALVPAPQPYQYQGDEFLASDRTTYLFGNEAAGYIPFVIASAHHDEGSDPAGSILGILTPQNTVYLYDWQGNKAHDNGRFIPYEEAVQMMTGDDSDDGPQIQGIPYIRQLTLRESTDGNTLHLYCTMDGCWNQELRQSVVRMRHFNINKSDWRYFVEKEWNAPQSKLPPLWIPEKRLLLRPVSNVCYELIRKGEDDTENKLGNMYLRPGQGYAIVLANGHYAGSPGCESFLGYAEKGRSIGLKALAPWRNRPAEVLATLGGSPDDIAALNATTERWLKKQGFAPADMPQEPTLAEFATATVSLPHLKTSADMVEFEVSLQAARKAITSLEIRADGVFIPQEWDKDLLIPAGQSKTLTVRVPLAHGQNWLEITPIDSMGIAGDTQRFRTIREGDRETTLYVITLGVSDYADDTLDLQYAAKDARDVAAAFEKYGSGQVKTLVLTDAEVSDENVLKKVREFLSSATVDDRVILYLAGHGMLDEQLEYRYAPAAFDTNNITGTGISMDALKKSLQSCAARKHLLLLDTCHSGSLGEEDMEKLAANGLQLPHGVRAIQNRGMKVKAASAALGNAAQKKRYMEDFFTSHDNVRGINIIAGTAGSEFALESDTWQNGVFAASIVETLKNRLKSDLNADGFLNVDEFQTLVVKRVGELTGGTQVPTSVSSEDNVMNIAVGRMPWLDEKDRSDTLWQQCEAWAQAGCTKDDATTVLQLLCDKNMPESLLNTLLDKGASASDAARAIAWRNPKLLRIAFARGATADDANALLRDGGYFDTESMRILLDAGGDVKCAPDLLHSCNNAATLNMLLEAGADPNGLNRYKEPVIIEILSQFGTPISTKLQMLQILLQHGANVNAQNDRGDTVLHSLLYHPDVKDQPLIEALLRAGADINIRNNQGRRPQEPGDRNYEYLCRQAAMIQNGVPPRRNTAAPHANRASLDPLIARMAALKCKQASSALYQKRLLTLLPMIRNGADVDLTLPETKGNTALHYSCAIGSLSITRWLLEHGANANAVTDKGATPLQCVGSDNRAAIIQALKAHGAGSIPTIPGSASAASSYSNGGDRSSLDPLIARMAALKCKQASSALYQERLLTLLPMIRNGADVDLTLPETKGNTALHYSCAIGSLSITRWLLEHGANANAVTDKGATPLQCVGSDNRAAIIQALKAHGAQ